MNTKGDILIGEKTNHPIVYLREKDTDSFIGCIITHSNTNDYKNNITLVPEHFETHNKDKNKYRVRYDGSYFVKLNLIKKTEWGPFTKEGKLTKTGIEFIENNLEKIDPILWREYINSK
jgi:hypothetical protein